MCRYLFPFHILFHSFPLLLLSYLMWFHFKKTFSFDSHPQYFLSVFFVGFWFELNFCWVTSHSFGRLHPSNRLDNTETNQTKKSNTNRIGDKIRCLTKNEAKNDASELRLRQWRSFYVTVHRTVIGYWTRKDAHRMASWGRFLLIHTADSRLIFLILNIPIQVDAEKRNWETHRRRRGQWQKRQHSRTGTIVVAVVEHRQIIKYGNYATHTRAWGECALSLFVAYILFCSIALFSPGPLSSYVRAQLALNLTPKYNDQPFRNDFCDFFSCWMRL